MVPSRFFITNTFRVSAMSRLNVKKNNDRNDIMKAALFIGPTLIVIFTVIFYPLVKSIIISFTDRILAYSKYSFVGFENYVAIFNDPLFWHALGNSWILVFFNVSISLFIGLGLAMLLNSRLRFTGVFRSLLFLPWAMPSMVIALMFRWSYNDIYGYPNYFLVQQGIIDKPLFLLSGEWTAWIGILLPIIWCYYPFIMLVFLAALQSIDRSLYESAAIDGAGRWQTFRHITLPALTPVIFVVCILEIIWSFSAFDLVYLLTGGGPANSTLTLSLYVYKKAFQGKLLGYGAALGTIMFFVLTGFTLLYFWAIKKIKLYEN